jgi:hypothetical protein
MREDDQGNVKDFLLPFNVIFFQIGETMGVRKFFAKTANFYHQTSDTVTLELKGKSPTGCIGTFKIRMGRKEAKELANNMLKAL